MPKAARDIVADPDLGANAPVSLGMRIAQDPSVIAVLFNYRNGIRDDGSRVGSFGRRDYLVRRDWPLMLEVEEEGADRPSSQA